MSVQPFYIEAAQPLGQTIDVTGMEGFFFACCPSEAEYNIDDIADAIELNGRIIFLINWSSSIIPVHNFIGPLIHRMKDQIIQIYGEDQFQACLDQHYDSSKRAVSQPYGHYSFCKIVQILKCDGILQAEIIWSDSYATIEDLHESLLARAEDLVIGKFGHTAWNLLQHLYLLDDEENM